MMFRYSLRLCAGTGFIDYAGRQELLVPDPACPEAHRAARDIMAADFLCGGLDPSSFVEAEDDSGQLLFALTFAEAVNLENGHRPPPGAPTCTSALVRLDDLQAPLAGSRPAVRIVSGPATMPG